MRNCGDGVPILKAFGVGVRQKALPGESAPKQYAIGRPRTPPLPSPYYIMRLHIDISLRLPLTKLRTYRVYIDRPVAFRLYFDLIR